MTISEQAAGLDVGRDEGETHGRWDRPLVVLATAASAIPIVFAGVRANSRGWFPTGDDAYSAVRGRDVFTSHPPLLGTWSSASQWSHRWINHPGPAQFDALAIPVRVLGPGAGVAIGTALINALCTVAIAWLTYRRAGPRLAAAAMVVVGALSWSMGSELLYDPWSQHAPIFPFALFLFAVWGVADGDLAALPVAVVAGSFALQTHLSYVLLVPGLAAWAVVGVALSLRQLRTDDPTNWPSIRRRSARWLVASLALLVLSWTQPLYEQVTVHPGNLSSLAASAGATPPGTPGIRGAVQAVGDVVALPPLWLPPGWGHPTFHPRLDGPGRPLVVPALGLTVFLCLGAWVTFLAIRRRDRTAWTALVTAGAAIVLAFASVAHSTSPFGLEATYVRWLWPISMFSWLVLGFAACRAAAAATPTRFGVSASRRPWTLAGGVVVALVVGGLTLPTVDNGNASPSWAGPAANQLFRRASQRLEAARGPLLLDLPASQAAFSIGPAMMAKLQSHGIDFKVRETRGDRALVRQLGTHRRWNGRNATERLLVAGGEAATRPPPGLETLAFSPGLDRRGRTELEQLSTVLQARIRTSGRARLSPVGQRLAVARHLPADVKAAVDASAHDPASVLRGRILTTMLHFRLLDTAPLGRADLVRYARLHDTWEAQTAALMIGPLPGST